MSEIYTVTLEILRPGPVHNQLLSPLTPYMAVCGEGGPVTFHLNFEHRQLLNRLSRLRYQVPTADLRDVELIPETLRQAEVQELGAEVARILAKIPALIAEISRARTDKTGIIHLRLVLSGSELALIPFELSNAPDGFPGERLELLLQASAPITLTREIRRGRPLPVPWNRVPRILFASAQPAGVSAVPAREHLRAIRKALEPWIPWAPTPKERLPQVKQRMKVLPDASLEDIAGACAQSDFTHVHILAHGAPFQEAGEQRFGLVLCAGNNRSEIDIVSGKRLAQALRAARSDRSGWSHPAVVTLATCDSGAHGSVLTPGGSIAHDLHACGIPCVFASQFPLTKRGSVSVAESLYSSLLSGDDPRLILHELRQRLYSESREDHDWGSLVAYASLPEDFGRQLDAFRERQINDSIDVAFGRADKKLAAEDETGLDAALADVNEQLERWVTFLPDDDSFEAREKKAECFGRYGSSKKRSAELFHRLRQEEKAMAELDIARNKYEEAMKKGTQSHWTATQYLSLTAVLEKGPQPDLWAAARGWAQGDLDRPDLTTRAWAHGSLAELELLGVYHSPSPLQPAKVARRVKAHCMEIVRLAGAASFEVLSTARQFRRYKEWWDRKEWRSAVAAALRAFPPVEEDVKK
jgi:hypothetical protein